MTFIDAHVHLWDRSAHPLSWFREGMGLDPLVSGADLAAVSSARAVVAVQAADTVVEARWLQRQAQQHPLIAGVVLQYVPSRGAWAGASGAVLDDSVRGIRAAVPQFAADLSDVAGLDALCAGLARSHRVLEFLIRPAQVPAVGMIADRHPSLQIVICHLGLGSAEPDSEWRKALSDVAHRPNVSAKLSGILGLHTPDAARGIVDTAWASFGASRLMFGSDWPMSARHLPYDEVVSMTRRLLPTPSAIEQEAFWVGTAQTLYGV